MRQNLLYMSPITVSDVDIAPSETAKLLGAFIDSSRSLESHVSNISSAGYKRLRHLRTVRRRLPFDAAKTPVNRIVTSRLDYCNSLSAGQTTSQLGRLQRLCDAAAKFIYRVAKYSYAAQLLRDKRYWLRCLQRIEYKLCVIVY